MKDFMDKNWSHLLLGAFLVKSHLIVGINDHIVILGLAALSGYKMYLNSVFSKKVSDQISQARTELEMLIQEHDGVNAERRQEIRGIIDSNHREVDAAVARVVAANQEEFSKLKNDVGQVGLAQGIGNDKKGNQIFF